MQTKVLGVITWNIDMGAANITPTQQILKLQNFAAKVALANAAKVDHATPF